MIKVRFVFKTKADDKEIYCPDGTEVTSLETAEEEIKKLIEEFNEEEIRRHGDKKTCREFVKLLDVGDEL